VWGNHEGENAEHKVNSAVLFVYLWVLVSIAALIYIGNSTGNESSRLQAMRWALVGFANVCLTTMVLVVGLGAIEVEEHELEEDGFYGQTSVLLFLTCLFGLVQSIVFFGWIGKRLEAQRSLPEKSDGYVHVNYIRSPSHGFMGMGL
jgi:magnesium-transporting ATPase (P-type)